MTDVASFLKRIGDESAQSFLQKIDELGVAIDDPRIEDFLRSIDLVDVLYQGRTEETRLAIEDCLAKSTFKPVSATDIAKILEQAIKSYSLATDYQRIAEIVKEALTGSLANGFSTKILLGGILSFGLVLGAAFTGGIAVAYWLPQQIEAARLQDIGDLKYLGSKEGRVFRSIVKLNSGYLDTGRCQRDAAKNGYYLSKGKEKLTNVCLLLMP